MNVASTLAVGFALVAASVLACSDPSGPKDTDTTGTTGGTGATGSTSTSTPTTDGESTTPTGGASSSTGDSPVAAECMLNGGICVGQGTCAEGGGRVTTSGPGGCAFADGAAECCVPPEPKPDAKTCAQAGGVCAPIGGCLDVDGYFTTIDKGCQFSGNLACCVPRERCGDQTIDCCTDTAVFNPVCDEGVFLCMEGAPQPRGMCMLQ